ncbi:MAG: DUF456 domain-containing protein [Balneolaceae bacterium]
MELLWIALGVICILVGLIGAFLPVIPGLPFSYAGLWILQLSGVAQFSTFFLVAWGIVIVTVLLLENFIPAYTTKKYGGTVYGVTGSTIGMILGMLFFPPLGFFLGTLVGAFIGEFIYKQDVNIALKSAWGSFIGFLSGTAIKVTVAAMIAFSFFSAAF